MTKTEKTTEERVEALKKKFKAADYSEQADGIFIFKDKDGVEVKKGRLDDLETLS